MKLTAHKSQDLGKIMADIQAQEDEPAQKNWEELDKYLSHQIEGSTTVVTSQTAEIGAAEMSLTALESNLDSMRNLKASLENRLREVETCYVVHME